VIRRLLQLSRSEWILLLQAASLVLRIRLALWIWPYDRVRRYLQTHTGCSRSRATRAAIIRFTSAAGRFVPYASCLTLALAAEVLLRRHGYDACLRIGVSKSDAGALKAHAWVESEGRIVIGGEEVDQFTTLRPAGV
jgi:hypothetical protein